MWRILLLIPLIFVQIQLKAQERQAFQIEFKQGSNAIEENFCTNSKTLEKMNSFLENIYNTSGTKITRIEFTGSASPEGNPVYNFRLAQTRLESLASYVTSKFSIPDSIIVKTNNYIDWNQLKNKIETSDVPYKDEVLQVLNNTEGDSARKKTLMSISSGFVWKDLLKLFFPSMRNAGVVIITTISDSTQAPADTMRLKDMACTKDTTTLTDMAGVYDNQVQEANNFTIALKTNLLYDVALIPEVGIEIPIGKHWSAAANWEYAWWSHGSKDRFWRTYGGDASIRWWFGRQNREQRLSGHHIGPYGQTFIFDFETGGRGYMGGAPGDRLWDKACWAAGIEYGYSLPIARCLNLDFTIGLGHAGGQIWEYLPEDGLYIKQSEKRLNWNGPTKAEITLVWILGKRGGAR